MNDLEPLILTDTEITHITGKKRRDHQAAWLAENGFSISFTELTTYADKVQKVVSRVKKSDSDKTLAWLLERGIKFDGSSYMTQKQFEAQYKGKQKIMPYLGINEFLKEADMVRIVPVEAPRNYTADISLRKGSAKNSSLPVVVKKTELETDYPYLTKELAGEIGKSVPFVAKAAQDLNLKGDPKYHQAIRSSRSGAVQRYSEAAKQALVKKLADTPNYSPF